MKHEWKKHEKELYTPKATPRLISVPTQQFIMICGKGNPNDADFSERVSALYAVAYAIKMGYKATASAEGISDFTVYPLEGVWEKEDGEELVKENLKYTIMIRQPDFITKEMVNKALEQVKVKKSNRLYDEIFFATENAGLCVEILHIGPYDNEPTSFDKMDKFAKENGLEGKWVFTLQNPSIMPFLQYADNRNLREQIYKAYIDRGSQDNAYNNWANISKMVSLRVQKARLLGFPDYASYVLDDNMAKNSENVYQLCNRIWEAALPISRQEARELQKMIDKTGGRFKLAPWDWRYYAEKLKKEKYGLNETEISQYFPLEEVRKGAFYVANKLYGLTFEQLDNLPLPHPEALAFEVKDADGKHIGIYYADYFPRAGKSSGAWMDAFRPQSKLLNSSPVITNVCNFTKPAGDMPALLTFDEACTLFHEFGHALHGLLSECTYPSVAGTSVARDFVELPSQVMENWAGDPEVLKIYTHHWQTGEPMPQELIDKIQNSSHFNQGFVVTEFMSAALLDMAYHTIQNSDPIDAANFEKEVLDKIGLIPESPSATAVLISDIFSTEVIRQATMPTPGQKCWMQMLLLHSRKPEIFSIRRKPKLSGKIYSPGEVRTIR